MEASWAASELEEPDPPPEPDLPDDPDFDELELLELEVELLEADPDAVEAEVVEEDFDALAAAAPALEIFVVTAGLSTERPEVELGLAVVELEVEAVGVSRDMEVNDEIELILLITVPLSGLTLFGSDTHCIGERSKIMNLLPRASNRLFGGAMTLWGPAGIRCRAGSSSMLGYAGTPPHPRSVSPR